MLKPEEYTLNGKIFYVYFKVPCDASQFNMALREFIQHKLDSFPTDVGHTGFLLRNIGHDYTVKGSDWESFWKPQKIGHLINIFPDELIMVHDCKLYPYTASSSMLSQVLRQGAKLDARASRNIAKDLTGRTPVKGGAQRRKTLRRKTPRRKTSRRRLA